MHFMVFIAFAVFATFALVHFETPFVIAPVYAWRNKKALVASSADTAHDNAPGWSAIYLLTLKQFRDFRGNIDIAQLAT